MFFFSLFVFFFCTYIIIPVCISLVHIGDSWPQHTCIIRPSHWNTEVSIWITYGQSPHPPAPQGNSWWVWVAVRHRFFVVVVVVLLPLALGVKFIFRSSHSWKKCSMSTLFQAVPLLFHLLVCLWTLKLKDGWMVVSSLTLHSGQSYPGTREQPGSRTGTHPGKEKEDVDAIQ